MNLQLNTCQIRTWEASDAAALQRHANNRNIWRNLRDVFPTPYTLADAHAFLKFATEQKPQTNFAITTPSEPIGCIGLRLGEDVHRKAAELGYWLSESHWGNGIMTEAVNAFTTWAFTSFELTRIFAEPFASNTASIRVLSKASFTLEGRLRKHVFKNGQILDSLIYARLRD